MKSLTSLKQLQQLRLGNVPEKASGNSNRFTEQGFKTMMGALKQLPELTVL